MPCAPVLDVGKCPQWCSPEQLAVLSSFLDVYYNLMIRNDEDADILFWIVLFDKLNEVGLNTNITNVGRVRCWFTERRRRLRMPTPPQTRPNPSDSEAAMSDEPGPSSSYPRKYKWGPIPPFEKRQGYTTAHPPSIIAAPPVPDPQLPCPLPSTSHDRAGEPQTPLERRPKTRRRPRIISWAAMKRRQLELEQPERTEAGRSGEDEEEEEEEEM
ncbi:hypothetical protein BDN71DRAFT_1514789 [Pleurotus eryngii]|uniref:Uncharacterized protein n=1 Tax=Pleurotus eryngii TaxID=5323 RepID=A0A9P5ZE83_PLEER|nr:hypothetical protein BDN71DRAFT_1514789 [Pleurotus eryngii]